jgi:hypothetical protein
MTEVRRIGPDGGFLREFAEFRNRVKSLETKPSGNIVIRETLIAEDPVTGVKTIIGQLPDGTIGFQPFVGDIVPPPVATTPVATSQPGTFTVSWDGLFVGNAAKPKDFVHVNVVGHKIVSGSTVLTVDVGVIRLPSESVFVTTDIAAIGETWEFSLESEDYNGNLAARSARSAPLVMQSAVTDQGINDALAALQADADAAQAAADNAQTAADDAQNAADAAAASAATAAGIANSKGKVIIQSSAPAVADQLAQNLWIDTTGGANTPKRWNGSAWVVVTDKVATDAAAAAAAAQTTADQAFNDAAAAALAAGTAQTTANGKSTVWRQDNPPAGTSHRAGDLWFDTNDGNKPYTWDTTSTQWISARDATIATAQSTADSAFTVANGKNKTYFQTSEPTGGTYNTGDTWVDTDNNYKLYTYSGSIWQATQDSAAAKAEAISAAATDATTKADAAQMAAIQAQAYSLNPSFEDWTGAVPANYATYNNAPTKETTTVRTGKYAARFNCTDTTTQRGLTFHTALAHAPNLEYFTLELDVRLVSGSSFGGAGVLLDWAGMTNQRVTVSLATEIPAPVTGKWYRVVKVLRRPTNATGTWTAMNGWLMGQYSVGMGTQAVKDIIYDWLNVRPATTEEITAYGTPASITTLTDTVNLKTRTWSQPSAPPLTGNTTGDLWFDTDDGNKPYIWNGAWTSTQDASIATAQGTANTALTAANGKNKVIYSTSAASGTTGYIAGDTWFQHNGSGLIIAQWEFTTSWQSRTLDSAVIANLNAGKITAGTLDVARLAASSISTDKLLIADINNYVENPDFESDTVGQAPKGYSNTGNATVIDISGLGGTYGTMGTAGNGTGKALALNAQNGSNNDVYGYKLIPVEVGDQFYVEYEARNLNTVGTGNAGLGFRTFGPTKAPVSWTNVSAFGTTKSTVWTKKTGSYTVPAGVAFIQVWITFANNAETTNQFWIDNLSIRRKNEGTLIVDGAIQAGSLIVANGAIGNAQIADLSADKINAGTIAAARLDAETIKSKLIEASYINAADIFAANSITSASGIFGTMDASVINAGTIAAARLDAAVIRSKLIDADLINAVDILVQNSITATNGIIGSIDAAKITVGEMSGARIAAKTITTDKLVITSTDNLIVESNFSNNGSSWGTLDANKSINATAGRGSLPALRITGTTSLQTINNLVNRVAVGTEDRFRGSMYVKSSAALAAGSIKLRMKCYTNATSSTSITVVSSPLLVANTWTLIEGYSPALPAGTIAVEFFIEVTNNATGTTTDIDYVAMTRAADGKLVVDGAIDGKTITGALFQTEATASRGIKLDGTGFKAYDPVGLETFAISAATGAVTSKGTFSTTGSEVVEGAGTRTISAIFGNLTYDSHSAFSSTPGILFNNSHSSEGPQTPASILYNGDALRLSTLDRSGGGQPDVTTSGSQALVGEGVANMIATTLAGSTDTDPNKLYPSPNMWLDAGQPGNHGFEEASLYMWYVPTIDGDERITGLRVNTYGGSDLLAPLVDDDIFHATMSTYSDQAGTVALGYALMSVTDNGLWAIEGRRNSDGARMTSIYTPNANGEMRIDADTKILLGTNFDSTGHLEVTASTTTVKNNLAVTGTSNFTGAVTTGAITTGAATLSSATVTGTLTVQGNAVLPIKHCETNVITSFPPNNTVWGPGTFAKDTNKSFNDGFVTFPAADQIKFMEAGVYCIHLVVWNNSTTYSASRIFLKNAAGTVIHNAQAKAEGGVWEFSISVPNFYATANEIVLVQFLQASGGTMQFDSKLRVTKLQ